jgi:hypothetical protein
MIAGRGFANGQELWPMPDAVEYAAIAVNLNRGLGPVLHFAGGGTNDKCGFRRDQGRCGSAVAVGEAQNRPPPALLSAQCSLRRFSQAGFHSREWLCFVNFDQSARLPSC